ncbi:hypothetical protein EX30DRAFT_111749 [Ascodesmis nigricans]|uniref:Uncharacterized protein n=1 Tax=Ascodesmis nigricans TaxID=341454 RepID=A0A4S2MQJ0_9PEZI|nr:hypothetical protein EX30DRAFT_111749 [Ascodesmis nigricans]
MRDDSSDCSQFTIQLYIVYCLLSSLYNTIYGDLTSRPRPLDSRSWRSGRIPNIYSSTPNTAHHTTHHTPHPAPSTQHPAAARKPSPHLHRDITTAARHCGPERLRGSRIGIDIGRCVGV